jgi:hypothetical protein
MWFSKMTTFANIDGSSANLAEDKCLPPFNPCRLVIARKRLDTATTRLRCNESSTVTYVSARGRPSSP